MSAKLPSFDVLAHPKKRARPPQFAIIAAIALACVLLTGAALAQPRPAQPPKSDPFAVTTWFELKPPSLESPAAPRPPGTLDLGYREDPGDIYVYGRKQKIPPREWQRQDFNNPRYLEAAGPLDRIQPPRTNCAAGAYNTVAGQPATGKDLMGVVGAGGSC